MAAEWCAWRRRSGAGNVLKTGVDIDTYDDHRMAMAFALAACGNAEIVINDPGCTRKTFPTYFEELAKLVEKYPGTRSAARAQHLLDLMQG